MRPLDVTRPEEYLRVVELLPDDLGEIVAPRIERTDEIALDLGSNLKLKVDGLRLEYPREVTEVDLRRVANSIGKFRDDGRRGLRGTLHRISAEKDPEGIIDKITIRIGRAIMGVAEPLRPWIEASRGIAVIGPPAVGKTTLLRDIMRIRAEQLGAGLIVVDSSNEITGDGEVPHPTLGAARRIQVGNPEDQAPKLSRAIANHGPEEVLLDEIGYRGDVDIVVASAKRGVTVIATMHGDTIYDVLTNPPLLPLLGITDARAQLKNARASFGLAIEVRGKGKFVVHENLDVAVERMLAGEDPAGLRVGRWEEQ